jgi:phosphoserine phosphatase RsbU/P
VIEDLLKRIPLFSSLPDSEITYLAATLTSHHFPAGELLLEEGKTDALCFFVVEGRVEVIKALGTPDEHRLGVREPGTLMGEMSLFSLQGAHTASVRALTPVSLLEVTRADLDLLLQRQPGLAYRIVGLISRRLEESENLAILDLREKNTQLAKAYQDLKAAQAQIIEREKIQRELDIARDIQLSFLPQDLPRLPGFEFGALMVPARAVGGDLYDFIPLGEGQIGLVIGDVSDKGIPAALVMALTYSLLRAEAFRGGSPGDVLRAVNRLLLDINQTGMFVTLLYGILDYVSGSFSYARAGHPYPLLLDAGGKRVELPAQTGQAIGLLDAPLIDEGRLVLPDGGVLCLFTDGLSEAPAGPQGEQFESEGVAEALSGWQGAPAQELCRRLWHKVQEVGPGDQGDDFTVVIVQKRAV